MHNKMHPEAALLLSLLQLREANAGKRDKVINLKISRGTARMMADQLDDLLNPPHATD